jgi:hypothetical protein
VVDPGAAVEDVEELSPVPVFVEEMVLLPLLLVVCKPVGEELDGLDEPGLPIELELLELKLPVEKLLLVNEPKLLAEVVNKNNEVDKKNVRLEEVLLVKGLILLPELPIVNEEPPELVVDVEAPLIVEEEPPLVNDETAVVRDEQAPLGNDDEDCPIEDDEEAPVVGDKKAPDMDNEEAAVVDDDNDNEAAVVDDKYRRTRDEHLTPFFMKCDRMQFWRGLLCLWLTSSGHYIVVDDIFPIRCTIKEGNTLVMAQALLFGINQCGLIIDRNC